MTGLLVVPMPQNEAMAEAVARRSGNQIGALEVRQFPDGETWLRYATNPNGCDVAIVCTLDRPDGKFLPLQFAANTARELGAKRVGLVAPYLAYMRQDRRFSSGEAVTSRGFANLISGSFDWLVTVDPHLHRQPSLSGLYTIPARAEHAAPLIAAWIAENVPNAMLIGPDEESRQWVGAIAEAAKTPFFVLEKIRHGDREVEIRVPNDSRLDGRTPVIIDDIISSGQTMLEAARQLQKTGSPSPVCMAVHGIFADKSDELLARAGAKLVTSNTVPHATNAIDVSGLLAAAILEV